MVAQVDRTHRADMRAIASVLAQRNALLRAGRDEEPVPENELAFWDLELARLSAAISLRREAAVRELRPAFRSAAQTLGAVDPIPDVGYAGQVQGATAEERAAGYRRLIEEKRDRERWQGVTLVGPHREDLAVAAGERPLPTFASRGEQRTAVLALKLAEAEWLRARTGELPVFLLDDVLSELDTSRREALCRSLPAGAQALLTTAVEASIPEPLHDDAAVIPVAREAPA
jgi:DNA replication and repair protein RecF